MRVKDFTKSLTKKPPKVFANLLLRVEKYINVEEAMEIKYQGHNKAAKEDKKVRYYQRGRNPRRDHNCQQRRRSPRTYPQFTLLKCSRKKVLLTMEMESLSTPLPWMRKGALKRDKSKFCDYHKDHGHILKSSLTSKRKFRNLSIKDT